MNVQELYNLQRQIGVAIELVRAGHASEPTAQERAAFTRIYGGDAFAVGDFIVLRRRHFLKLKARTPQRINARPAPARDKPA